MIIFQRYSSLLKIFIVAAIGMMSNAQNDTQPIVVANEKDFLKVRELFLTAEKKYREEKVKVAPTFYKSLISAEEWALKKGTSKQQLLSEYQVHFYYDQIINNDSIISTGNRLLSIKEFLKFPESAFVARATLDALNRKGYYTKQLELLPVFEKLNKIHSFNVLPEAYSHHHELGMIYYKLGNYSMARDNFILQREAFKDTGDYFRAASSSNNIALTYEREDDLNAAIEYYGYSQEFLKRDNSEDPIFDITYKRHFKNVVASNIASIKLKMGTMKGLAGVFKEELRSSKTVSEPRITVQAYTNLSEYYLLEDLNKLALIYNDSAMDYLMNFNAADLKARIHEVRGKILLKDNKSLTSQDFFNSASHIRDSIQRSRDLSNYNEAAIEFDLTTTQENLKQTTVLLEQKEKINSYQRVILALILLSTLLLGYQYFRIRKKNRAIRVNESHLSSALKAKEIMLEEIHHRIKNNLQMVSGILEIKSSKLTDLQSKEVIKDAQQHIQSMAYIHEHLYPQASDTHLHMQHYLETICDNIISNFPGRTVTATIKAGDLTLASELVTPLGLIACELITNSMKHAFENEGAITILLERKRDFYSFTYSDDGKGYDLEIPSTPFQKGNMLIKVLSEELNGTVAQTIDSGYHLQLDFKEAQ